MSDVVVIVAIVISALSMTTLGTVAIVMGCYFRFKAKAGPEGADIQADSKSQTPRRQR